MRLLSARFQMTQFVYTTTIEKHENARLAKNLGFNDGFFKSILKKVESMTKNDIENPTAE